MILHDLSIILEMRTKFFIWWCVVHCALLHFFVPLSISADKVIGNETSYAQASSLPDLNCTCVRDYQCSDTEYLNHNNRQNQNKAISMDSYAFPPNCGPFYVCCHALLSFEESVRKFRHQGCGVRNHNGIYPRRSSRKREATYVTEFGEYPWLAVLRNKDVTEDPRLECLGVLISQRHVLTRAHCAYRLREFIEIGYVFHVRLGEWTRLSQKEVLPHEDVIARRVFLHPDYNPENSIFDYNDVGIVELEKDVIFKPHIDTVCLPEEDQSDVFDYKSCIATTWTWHPQSIPPRNSSLRPFTLHKHEITVIPQEECQMRYDVWVRGHGSRKINESIICGVEKDQKSCFYDLGIPLVCYRPEDGRYQVVGIASSYINCYSGTKVPVFFMRIKTFLKWIKAVITK